MKNTNKVKAPMFDTLSKVGIFACTLMMSAIAAYIFAPNINSDAATQTAEQTVGPHTMSMANNSTSTINVTPTESYAVYSITNNLSVTNTCSAGATITMKTSGTSNALTRTATAGDTLTKTIAATTGTSLQNNSWGYSLDNGATWAAVPASNGTAATVYDESAARAATASPISFKFGVNVNNSIPSGAYTNDVVYTMTPKAGCLSYSVTWDMNGGTAASGVTYPSSLNWGQTVNLSTLTPTRNGYTFTGWSDGSSTYTASQTAANINSGNSLSITMTAQWTKTIFNISTMQEMTAVICRATTTPEKTATQFDWDGSHRGDTNYVPRKSLRDSRDGKYYLVSKLADGNCWMSQSLALDLTSGTAIVASKNNNRTMSATPNNTTQTTTGTTWAQAEDNWRSYKPQSSEAYYQSGTTKSSSPSGSGVTYDWEKAGNYYNWYAATAGTGTSSMTVTNSDATASICPKGWRLPSDTGDQSYYNLITTTYGLASSSDGSLALRANPLNFNLSGDYNYSNGAMSGQGSRGNYWSSTAYSSATSAYHLNFYTSFIYLHGHTYKGYGFSVRCVAI